MFVGLTPGAYTVDIDTSTLPVDRTGQTQDPDSVIDASGSVTVVAGTVDRSPIFGFEPDPPPASSIRSSIWTDTDADGVVDPGEPPLDGVSVELVDDAGTVIATTTTGADGTYRFDDVSPGDYVVRVVTSTLPPTISTITADHDGILDGEVDVTIPLGTDVDLEPWGYTPDAPVPTGRIGGVIFEDTNDNGVRDAGEPPMADIVVILFDAAGNEVAQDHHRSRRLLSVQRSGRR